MDQPGYRRAAKLEDLEDGATAEVEVESLPIFLHRRGSQVFATGVYCAHEDVRLRGDNCDGDIILCTAHGYRMNIRTGACLSDESLRLPTFPTLVEQGEVWVKLF